MLKHTLYLLLLVAILLLPTLVGRAGEFESPPTMCVVGDAGEGSIDITDLVNQYRLEDENADRQLTIGTTLYFMFGDVAVSSHFVFGEYHFIYSFGTNYYFALSVAHEDDVLPDGSFTHITCAYLAREFNIDPFEFDEFEPLGSEDA